MNSEFRWIVPNRVLLVPLSGDAEAMADTGTEIVDLLDTASISMLHVVHNMAGVKSSSNIRQLSRLVGGLLKHPKLGYIVLYGFDSRIVQFTFTMLMQLSQTRVKFVDSLDDALDWLGQNDHSLNEGSTA